jgi:hypothetical protein
MVGVAGAAHETAVGLAPGDGDGPDGAADGETDDACAEAATVVAGLDDPDPPHAATKHARPRALRRSSDRVRIIG